MIYVTVEDIIAFHEQEVGPGILVDRSALESAAARPQQSAFGEDAYPDFPTKAAALLDGVVNAHAFVDGNKRAGLGALDLFCVLNGLSFAASDIEAYEVTMAVAKAPGSLDIQIVAEMIQAHLVPLPLDQVPLDDE